MSFQTFTSPILAAIADRVISPLLKRINQRAALWPLGIFSWRSHASFESIVVAGRRVRLRFPDHEYSEQQWEATHLFKDDPYGLRMLPNNIRTVADIGGNIGFFSLLARHYFPQSTIHCYEPNPTLAPITIANTELSGIRVFCEGVGARPGRANLSCEGVSLCGTLQGDASGGIPITAIREVLDRLGGIVDLVKIDCEGGEWDILEDWETLKRIKHLAMEYHLELRPGQTVAGLVKDLNARGFFIDSLREAANPAVGQLVATNRALCP